MICFSSIYVDLFSKTLCGTRKNDWWYEIPKPVFLMAQHKILCAYFDPGNRNFNFIGRKGETKRCQAMTKFKQTSTNRVGLFSVTFFMLPSIQSKSLHMSKKPGSEQNFSFVFVAFHPLQSSHVNEPRRETECSTNTRNQLHLHQHKSGAVYIDFLFAFSPRTRHTRF